MQVGGRSGTNGELDKCESGKERRRSSRWFPRLQLRNRSGWSWSILIDLRTILLSSGRSVTPEHSGKAK